MLALQKLPNQSSLASQAERPYSELKDNNGDGARFAFVLQNRLWHRSDPESMDRKADLERLLTAEVLKREPTASRVTVFFDGHFAVYRVVDRYRLRKLSQVAQQFLREGGDIASVEKSMFEG